MRRVIGFSGRKRSGKSELSKCLVEECGAVRLSIASYLKELCYDLLGFTFEEGEEKKDNGTVFQKDFSPRWVNLIANATGIDKETLTNVLEDVVLTDVRQTLQVVGTDIIRRYDPEWHIRSLCTEIANYPKDTLIVVDDVRFPNELRELGKFGANIFYVVRPDCLSVSQHESETALSFLDFQPQNVIINNKSVEELKKTFLYKFHNGWDVHIDNGIFLSDCVDVLNGYKGWVANIKNETNPLIKEQLKRFL